MSLKVRTSSIARAALLLAVLCSISGAALTAQAAAAPPDSTRCEPGTGWNWTSGPAQPELAQRAQAALKERGIDAVVRAVGFGEQDSCGNFEPFSIDYSLLFPRRDSISAARQETLADEILPVLDQITEPLLGEVRVSDGTRTFSLHPAGEATVPRQRAQGGDPRAEPLPHKKVYLLVFDPLLSNGQNLSTYLSWNSYSAITQGVQDYFVSTSKEQIHFTIALTEVVTHTWPTLTDGYVYTEPTYFDVLTGQSPPHSPAIMDYDWLVESFAVCDKANGGQIDEVWLFGGPWFGFYESRLVGPKAYPYNSPTMSKTHGCSRLVPIMGLSYERGLAEAVHSFGHRSEASMTKVYGSWQQNRTSHNWERFGLVQALSPKYSYSGCGSIHYPPNGTAGYDYANQASALTNCEDFRNYPDLSAPETVAQPVSCTLWNCDHLAYLSYWFDHLPSQRDCGSDSVANNWWPYFLDPSLALAPSSICTPPATPTATPASTSSPTARPPTATIPPTATEPVKPTSTPAAFFADVPASHWARPEIETIYVAGITAGCGQGSYCPAAAVTRAQMAVFLLRSIHGSSYGPPPAGTTTGFADVPATHWAAAWIKQLAAESITSGCGSGNYCPDAPVNRAQMAVFLLRAKHGAAFTPPAVGTSTGFGDVPTDHWAAAFIKQLVAEGITVGCGNGNYCADAPVTRAQMAVFLVRTFNLP